MDDTSIPATNTADPSYGASPEAYRRLVEATATVVWWVASDGVFAGVQPGWQAFTGQTEAEYSGWGWTNAIHPDDRQRSAEAWADATDRRELYIIEHRVRRHDGEWRDMLANAVPIFGATGALERWIGSHTDITEQKRIAAALNETTLQMRTLADNVPQLIWTARADGRVFWFNQRWFDFTGATADEDPDRAWRAVQHPDHATRVEARLAQAVETGRAWEDTFPIRSAAGGYRWFLGQALPVRGNDGAVIRWFGTLTDVTRQRAQEQELALAREQADNANRAKSEFIANMSHELRTPLSAVIGYAEMLEEEAQETDNGDAMLPDLRKINQNARHLLSLINNVLDLSKIEAERMEVFLETFNVSSTIEDICSTVHVLMEKKGNRLAVDAGDEPLGEMHSDQTKFRQCVINLLSNAAKFTEGGTVTLRVRRSSEFGRDWLVFDIADTGIGMSPDQLQRLFQRFTQADASTTRRFGGTGLGLAITKAFCKLLGGDIAVTSRENAGTTFTIKLPAIATATVVETVVVKPVTAAERAAHEAVVLAIDDDPSSRDLVSRFLLREGFLVRTAPDGIAGLEAARVVRPDVILLDVTMPRMDGWAVLTALKGDPALAHIPVVMLTVIDQHSLGFALGASDYLLKPVQWGQLRKVLDRFARDVSAPVLVVDDDPDLRARLEGLLTREGFRVATAENGREALDRLAEIGKPSLILSDLVMPEMDGFAFIRAVRAQENLAAVPIVVLTSKDLSRQEFQDLKRDTEGVLSKSKVDLPELAAEVRALALVRRGAAAPSFAPAGDDPA